jgi:hypothetical protein
VQPDQLVGRLELRLLQARQRFGFPRARRRIEDEAILFQLGQWVYFPTS